MPFNTGSHLCAPLSAYHLLADAFQPRYESVTKAPNTDRFFLKKEDSKEGEGLFSEAGREKKKKISKRNPNERNLLPSCGNCERLGRWTDKDKEKIQVPDGQYSDSLFDMVL